MGGIISLHTEYLSVIRSISQYSVRMRENACQNNSQYGHFLRSAAFKENSIRPERNETESYRYQVWHRFQSRHDILKMMQLVRSSFPGEFLGVGLHKICCKFTGEQSRRSRISIKLQSNFMAWLFSGKYVAYFQKFFS